MTIIYSKKVTPASVASIKKSEAFIAFVTEAFIKEKERYAECLLAAELGKPMYAIVKKEAREWSGLNQFELPWRKIYYTEEQPPDSIVKDIEKDLEFYKKVKEL